MKKAILTVSVGQEAQELSEFSRPTFMAYARRHGYKVFTITEPLDDRPASWSKLPLMIDFIGGWDTIVCIDNDAMICRWDQDYFQQVLDMTVCSIAFGVESHARTPNCGLWIVRGKSEYSLRYLQTVDSMSDYYWDPCVEQEAVHHLLGYLGGLPSVVCARDTVLLPPRYNDVYHCCDDAIVKHWAGQRHRMRVAGMFQTLTELGLDETSVLS